MLRPGFPQADFGGGLTSGVAATASRQGWTDIVWVEGIRWRLGV